jgi:hypothetical protein
MCSNRIFVLLIAGVLAACGQKQEAKQAQKPEPSAQQNAAAPDDLEEQFEADQTIYDIAGPWDFSGLKGDPTCRIRLAATPQAGSFALTKDASCDAVFPMLQKVNSWMVNGVGDITFTDAERQIVLTFTQQEDGYYTSTTPAEETYALANQDESDFALPSPRTQIEGNWSINILGGATQCSLQLKPSDEAATNGDAALGAPCPKPTILMGVKSFRKTGETLALLDDSGTQVAAFQRGDSVTWRQSAPIKGHLFLTR